MSKSERRHQPRLMRLFLRELERLFPGVPIRAAIEPMQYRDRTENQLAVRLASPHSEVPELWVTMFAPRELTVNWGRPWHWHICTARDAWENGASSAREAEATIVGRAVQFVGDVLADRKVIGLCGGEAWSVHPAGESPGRTYKEASEYRHYVWSGRCSPDGHPVAAAQAESSTERAEDLR